MTQLSRMHMEATALFLDAENGELVTNDLDEIGGHPHLLPDDLHDMDIEPEETSVGYGDLVPALGYNDFDGHVFVSGATNSGKSFFINKMLMHDNKKREVFMFTDLKTKDPSFEPLFNTDRLKVVREEAIEDWEISQKDFRNKVDGSIVVFDDATDPDVKDLMDSALLRGRHRKTVVVAVNHKLRDWGNTKHLLNDAKYIIGFPNSNRGTLIKFIREEFDTQPRLRRFILKKALQDGRQIIFHRFAPNAIATAKTVFIV